MRKVIFTLCFFFSALLLQQCRDKCDSGKLVNQQKISHYELQSLNTIDSLGTLKYRSFDSMQMKPDDTVIVLIRPELILAQNNTSELLMACDPVMPNVLALGDSLKIFTAYDFDLQHPAGSEISDLFIIFNMNFQKGDPDSNRFRPLEEFRSFTSSGQMLALGLIKKPENKDVTLRLIIYRREGSSIFNFYNELPPIFLE